MTEMVQPIDAGYGQSLQMAIGRELDSWLMDATNLLKWEGKMTAMERRILVTHLVARAQEYMLLPENDHKRINCFERTGYLITVEAYEKDKLIKPQGVTIPFVVPVLSPPVPISDTEDDPEPQESTEESVGLQTITDMLNEVDMEDAELILNDHTDGGDVILQTVDI